MTVERPTPGSALLSWTPAAAVALVLCVALGVYDGLFEERRGFTAMASVAGVTGVGVAAAVTRRRREAELASVRSIAEVAQRVLLRPVPRTACPLQAAVSYTSAVAEARIGGDLYEMVASPHGIRVIVGDVQGKGLAAVETAVVVLGAFRAAAHDEPDLVSLGERLERSVASRNRSHSPCLSGWGRTAPTARSPTGWTSLPGNSCCCTPTGSPKRGTRGDRSTHLVTGRTCSRPPTPSAPWRPCKGNPHET